MAYQQVTLAQFQTDLLSMVETVPYWTASEATTAINEALRIWNLLTGQWKDSKYLATTQNTHWYTTPTGILVAFRLVFHNVPLYKTTWFDLDYGKTGWEGQNTSSTGVPTSPNLWTMAGINRLVIWPADASSSASNMTVEGIASTPQLSSSSDYVDLGREEQGAILSYALHKLSFKEGGPRFQAASQHFRRFIAAAANRSARLKAATFYRQVMTGKDLSYTQKPLLVAPPPPQGAPPEENQ